MVFLDVCRTSKSLFKDNIIEVFTLKNLPSNRHPNVFRTPSTAADFSAQRVCRNSGNRRLLLSLLLRPPPIPPAVKNIHYDGGHYKLSGCGSVTMHCRNIVCSEIIQQVKSARRLVLPPSLTSAGRPTEPCRLIGR